MLVAMINRYTFNSKPFDVTACIDFGNLSESVKKYQEDKGTFQGYSVFFSTRCRSLICIRRHC